MTKDEALKLALDALENHTAIKHPQQIHYRDAAIDAIKEALAQPAQEPDELTIAYMSGLYDGKKAEREACAKVCEQPIDEIQITDTISEVVYMDAHECAAGIRARGNT